MTIAAFLNRDRSYKWLEGMKELGYGVTEEKVSPSGTVHMLDKPATTSPTVAEADAVLAGRYRAYQASLAMAASPTPPDTERAS